MVVVVKFGVLKIAPVASKLPPVCASYHEIVPVPVAVKLALSPLQIVAPAALGAAGKALTVRVALAAADVQPFKVSVTL